MKICRFLATIQAHILYSKFQSEFWPAFSFAFFSFKKGRLAFPKEMSVPIKQSFMFMFRDQMFHPPWWQSPNNKFTLYDSLIYVCIYNMRVKAKIWVRGGRQINDNKIPDIWQMAVRRFSRVQSMPSCLYEVYRAHWTRGAIRSLEETQLSNK